jgi:hypothetical protein
MEGKGKLRFFIYLIRDRTRDLLAVNRVPQATELLCAHFVLIESLRCEFVRAPTAVNPGLILGYCSATAGSYTRTLAHSHNDSDG